jgi:3-oxoadipate enol-lactonase/4-carboxymuconolactone decarboxylase
MRPPVTARRIGSDGQPADERRRILVLGPSLGTSAATLWGEAAAALAEEFDVITWDLPGHGGAEPATAGYSVAELADAVLAAINAFTGDTFAYAGDSMGGAVGMHLLLTRPGRVSAASLLCTGARIGTARGWSERAELVRERGVEATVAGSVQRWFHPGFADRHPASAAELIEALRAVDTESYALACEALGGHDVRDRLGEIGTPVLAVAGASDQPTPVESLREIADGVVDGRLVVLDGVAHLAPAEAPARVACLIAAHSRRAADRPAAAGHGAGMRVRRAVIGDEYVDRAVAATTDLTRDFQDLITRYAWGEIWNRPGLDRRSRSMITMTAMVAGGHQEELALHLRGARNNGLTDAEIAEVLMQTAIYCGVPKANTAFRIAQRVLGEQPDRAGEPQEPRS